MKSKYLLFILVATLLMLPFKVSADDLPEQITITSNPIDPGTGLGSDYPTLGGYRLSMIESNAGGAFCIQGEKNAPTQGCVYGKTSIYTDDPGMVWLLGQKIERREDYHTVQGAIYRYIGMKGTDAIFNVNRSVYPLFQASEGSYTHTAAAISLSNQAMNQTSDGSGSSDNNAYLEFRNYEITGSEACEGDYIKTKPIMLYGENINWDTLTVSVAEVPSEMVEKNCSGNSCTLRLKIPVSAAQGHTSLSLQAEAEINSYGGRYYVYTPIYCSDARPQEILFRGPGTDTRVAGTTISLNPDACADYSLDVNCGNCDETGDDPSFIIQDTTNWSAILNSSKSSNDNVKDYFDQAGNSSTGSGGGKCHVYCREEYRVYFPNESDEINVDTGRHFTFNLEGDIVIGTVPNYKEVKVEKVKECQATEEYEVTDKNGNTRTEERSSASCMSQYDSNQKTPKAGETGDVTIQYEETYEDSVYNANNPIDLIINEERQKIPQETVNGASATYEVVNLYELPTDTYRYINIQTGESSFKRPTDDITNNYRDLKTENLPISYENYGINVGGENVGAYVGFVYKLPGSSNMSDAFKDDNDYFKTASTSNDNLYTKYVNNGYSDDGDAQLREQLENSTCAEKYGYGTAGFNTCAEERMKNKAGSCIADINSGLNSEYYQCEVLVCEEDQYVGSDGKCHNKPGGGDPGGGDPGGGDPDGGGCDDCLPTKKCCPGLNMICPDKNGNCPYPGGLDIIYRTIDLSDPFPGQDAKNRDTGWNWCSYNVTTEKVSCAGLGSGNPVVYQNILNNRGVTSEAVYNKTPMYEFDLTPDTIKSIRSYNDSHRYSDWTLKCSEKDNGDKVCWSAFLRNNSSVDIKSNSTCANKSNLETCAEDALEG